MSAAGASIAPARVRESLARIATVRPSIRASPVTMLGAKSGRSSISVPTSTIPSMAARGSNARLRSAGTTARRASASGATPGSAPWKSPKSRRATSTASASSRTTRSTEPAAAWTATGPTSSGATTPSPPPSIMAGPPMPIEAPSTAITMSQQPSSAALPAKQRPAAIPISGTWPDSRAKRAKAPVSRPVTTAVSVSPGRPPPPSAKSTTGRPRRSASSKSRSFLAWLRWPWVPARTM